MEGRWWRQPPSSVRAAMARRSLAPGTRRARAACTCCPSISSTTEEKVLPSTWASLVGLAPSLPSARTRERARVSQRKSSLSSHCWISPSSGPGRRRRPGRAGPGGTPPSRQSRKNRERWRERPSTQGGAGQGEARALGKVVVGWWLWWWVRWWR